MRFYCVWSFLKPYKSRRNAVSPSEVGLQFLQAMIRNRARAVKVPYIRSRLSWLFGCHVLLEQFYDFGVPSFFRQP